MRMFGAVATLLAVGLVGAWPARAESEPTVRWGGRAFSEPSDLATWLDRRGLAYPQWARNHPSASARLEDSEAPGSGSAAPARRAVPKRPTHPTTDHAAAGEATRASIESARSPAALALTAVLAVSAAALLVLAVLPALPQLPVRVPLSIAERQTELGGVGLAVAVAVIAASFL